MTRFFTIAAAAMLAACIGTSAWSQGGQGGGGGTSGGAGASGTAGSASASGAAGTSGSSPSTSASNVPGTAGTTTAGQGGTTTAGQGGTTTAGQGGTTTAGAAGRLQNPSNVPGSITPQAGFNVNGPSQNPFFADPGVRQQLNLNDNQFNTLNRAHLEAFNRFNQGASGLGNNLNEQQRAQQLQALEAQFNQQFGQSLDTTFTNPRMRNRFNQLNTQFRGAAAFNDPAIRRQLNLTPAQQRQMRRLDAAWRQRMRQLRRAGNDQQLTDEQFAQLQAQNMAQINSVFTPEQRQIWGQISGEPFNFSRRAFFGDEDGIPGGPPPALGGTQQTQPRNTGNLPQSVGGTRPRNASSPPPALGGGQRRSTANRQQGSAQSGQQNSGSSAVR